MSDVVPRCGSCSKNLKLLLLGGSRPSSSASDKATLLSIVTLAYQTWCKSSQVFLWLNAVILSLCPQQPRACFWEQETPTHSFGSRHKHWQWFYIFIYGDVGLKYSIKKMKPIHTRGDKSWFKYLLLFFNVKTKVYLHKKV